jgi:phosphoenolpyruvate synthase/pyruvate phosphate dikinase
MPMTREFARPLAAVGDGDRLVAGGKAASLGELTAAGLPVPPGFAVTTAAFWELMAALDPEGSIPAGIGKLPADDPAAITELTARVRAAILAAPWPPGVADAIGACYRELSRTAGLPGQLPVAVRSSATGEDSPDASFAGLADSFLWVAGEQQVARHVRRCWASLYTAEAVSYRRHQRLPEPDLGMAVVVQAMVEPRCAGVMFTRSPVTGDRSVTVVEAAWGLGSALVSGDVTPDSYVVSKVTGEIVRQVATKVCRHRRGEDGTGVRVEEVPAALRTHACLTDAEVRALAELGQRVSGHYGTPQDIEWAAPEEGTSPAGQPFVVLQSRPETVWSRRERAPAAAPKARPFDHVLDRLSMQSAAGRPAGRGRHATPPGQQGGAR